MSEEGPATGQKTVTDKVRTLKEILLWYFILLHVFPSCRYVYYCILVAKGVAATETNVIIKKTKSY